MTQPAAPLDPMTPRQDGRPVLCGPLSGLVLASGDLERCRRFYGGALDLRVDRQHWVGEPARKLRDHWGAAGGEALDLLVLTRSGLPDALTVHVVQIDGARPTSRPGLDCRYDGPLGLGVPVRGLARRHAIVEAYGFEANAGVTTMTFPRADGTTYDIGETHWVAPDDVMVPGVDRAHLQPVGSIDTALEIGGPSYASTLVSDVDRCGEFFDTVLGYELRREFTFESEGPEGGMRLAKGLRVRFQQWFAPGSRTGYLVIMQLLEGGLRPPNGLGLFNRGIGLWSFPTTKFAAVQDRVARQGVKVLSPPADIGVPGLGSRHSMVVATPDGFPVEIVRC